MSKHTPGKLAVSASLFDNEGCPETVIVGADKNAFVAVAIDFGENNPNMREANARRIVAAWNACELMPTEDVERLAEIGEGVMRLSVMADDNRAERDRLSAINAELLEALKTARDHIDMEALRISHCNDAEQIGAAIAKAQVEQPCQS